MARHIEDEVEYYYDSHSTEEDLMGETAFHRALVRYLVDVLTWLFQGQLCAIYDNLNIYQTANPHEYPLAPDATVIKGVAYQPTIRSWRVGKSGPAPQVVFEIASEETWKKDLKEKPLRYARMGVHEYFAYDPHELPLPASRNRRLFGWQLDQDSQIMQEMRPAPDGSLWSASLESWLVPDGATLRLYDRNGQMRLTYGEAADQRAEAEARQKQAEAKRADFAMQQAEAEARRVQAEAQRADAAIQQAEAEARRAQAEAQRADAAVQQAQALAEKLRSLGVDPGQLL
ncbi:MAG TPA: Uma2 family endonuclease [Ktedonobacteraceae bacterium]|nr:Uma2 family endonuclease [Ktedonobacteraceae bacterium]